MKKLVKEEMKTLIGGAFRQKECAANCHPGFVSIECAGTCISTEDVGVKCGTKKMCCFGGDCDPK